MVAADLDEWTGFIQLGLGSQTAWEAADKH